MRNWFIYVDASGWGKVAFVAKFQKKEKKGNFWRVRGSESGERRRAIQRDAVRPSIKTSAAMQNVARRRGAASMVA